jgi:hypothetical protein
MNDVTKVQAVAAVRQVALLVGGWAVGRGYLDDDTLTMLVTIAVIVVPLIWGQSSTRKLAKSNGE